jgi:hypothetical protein
MQQRQLLNKYNVPVLIPPAAAAATAATAAATAA